MGISGARKLEARGISIHHHQQAKCGRLLRMYYLPESRFPRRVFRGDCCGKASFPQRPRCTPFHIGFIGTIKAAKGWRRVVEAARLLRERGKNVTCTIAGDGPESQSRRKSRKQNATWLGPRAEFPIRRFRFSLRWTFWLSPPISKGCLSCCPRPCPAASPAYERRRRTAGRPCGTERKASCSSKTSGRDRGGHQKADRGAARFGWDSRETAGDATRNCSPPKGCVRRSTTCIWTNPRR